MYGFEQKLSGRKGISMIEIKDVSLNLNKRQILDHVFLKLQEGKIYGLVGNNGSGKTMLMKCVCGFIHPTSGIVLADGKVIGKDVDYLPDAGVIIETPGFISYYSGLQNLKVLAGIKNKIGNLQIRDAMKRVGLDPDLKLSVKKYSLGMRQRLGLAQAMMESPSMLPVAAFFQRIVQRTPKNGEDICRRHFFLLLQIIQHLRGRRNQAVITVHEK